jgi:hypothetical protein
MAQLTHEIQTFIVQSLARWSKPSWVVKAVKAEFGVQIDRRQVDFYNPERGGSGKRLGQEWKDLFATTRKAFIDSTAGIGIAHKAYRLAMLYRIAERAEEAGNMPLAMDALEQAAKEQGGLYTNRRKLDVNPRDALAKLLGCTPEELPMPEEKEWLN